MLRDNLVGLIEPMLGSAGANLLALCTARKKPSDDRPPCLENPRPEGAESTLTENAASPFHAEPRHYDLLRLDLSQIKNSYVAESQRQNETWVRTPSIVLSEALGELRGGVGGHNLSSEIGLFRADSGIAAGDIRIVEENGKKVILYSEADSDKISEGVRAAGRNGDKSDSELQTIVEQNIKNAASDDRPMEQALGFKDAFRPDKLRGFQPLSTQEALANTGWKPVARSVEERHASLLDVLTVKNSRTVLVERQPSGNFVIAHGASKQLLEAANLPSAVDAAVACVEADGGEVQTVTLHLRGFEPRQARGFVKNTEINLDQETAPKLIATIEEQPIEPGELSEILKQDYDFHNATIERISDPIATSDGQLVEVDLKAPAKVVTKPPLLMRIKLLFQDGFRITQDVITSIQSAIGRWQQLIVQSPENVDALFAAKGILKDLRSVHPEIRGVSLNLQREGKDILIVHNGIPQVYADLVNVSG
jgi:hypothetical protein